MAQKRTYGDNLTFAAFADVLEVDILVLSIATTRYVTNIPPRKGHNHSQIVIGYYPHYYLSLRKQNTEQQINKRKREDLREKIEISKKSDKKSKTT
jgi:hypothetical protein